MQNITLKELFMSAEELSALESEVAAGNFDAQFKLLLYYIYGPTPALANEIFKQVTQLCENGNPMALAYAGFLYEHALGVKKDYCKAVEYYSKAYDAGSAPAATKRTVSAPKTEAELGKMYSAICKEISRIVNLPAFCVFEKDAYHITLNQKSIKVYEATMPALISQIDEFQASLESAMPGMSEEDAAQWEYRLQDTVLVPLEIFKKILFRYFLRYYLESNDFVCISEDEYFSNAIGRCIVDDDETDDNDYIIGGLLQMAGHDESPLWQYRVGLWFENSDRNLEPLTAADWYAKAQGKLPAAKAALKRVKTSQSYQILQGRGNGTVKECQELSNRTSVNPQNSILWLVESAIRGDETALMRLEQKHISPTGGDAVLRGEFKPDPYYKVIAEETRKDEVISDIFFADKLEESKKCKKAIALQHAREEEARRNAEEEARRKEEEAIRKIEREKRQAELAEKRKEASRKRAERIARKNEEERIQAEQEAIRRAEEEARRKEEAEKKKILDVQRARQELLDEVESLGGAADLAISEIKSDYEDKFVDLKNRLNSAYNSLSTRLETCKPQWWQYVFCVSGNKDVDNFLRVERSTNQTLLTCLEDRLAKATTSHEKIESSLRTGYSAKSDAALRTFVTKLKKQIKELQSTNESCRDDVKAIEKQIKHLSNDVSVSDFKWEFSGRKTIVIILLLWMLISLLMVIFTDGGFVSLLLSCGAFGSLLYTVYQDEVSIKNFLLGFVSGAGPVLIIAFIIFLITPRKDFEEIYYDAMIEAQEAIDDAIDEAQETIEQASNSTKAVVTGYDYVYSPEENGWCKVELNDKYGYIDANGKEIIKPKYDYIYSPEDNGWRKVELNDKYGFVNSSGKEVVSVKYDYIYSEDDNGWRKVEIDDKKGYIDASGKEIIPPVYDYIYSWSGGLLKVEKGNKTGYVNRDGKLVQPLE